MPCNVGDSKLSYKTVSKSHWIWAFVVANHRCLPACLAPDSPLVPACSAHEGPRLIALSCMRPVPCLFGQQAQC